jgi:hypothetical protein
VRLAFINGKDVVRDYLALKTTSSHMRSFGIMSKDQSTSNPKTLNIIFEPDVS